MLRIKERSRVPAGGFQYTQKETGAVFIAHTIGRIVKDVQDHRKANSLPLPATTQELTAEIENSMCLERPWICEDSPGSTGGPTILQMVSNFATSITRWAKEGFPTVDEATFNARVAKCAQCPHQKGWSTIGIMRCRLCGCANGTKSLKLTMATEKCPDNPPRW